MSETTDSIVWAGRLDEIIRRVHIVHPCLGHLAESVQDGCLVLFCVACQREVYRDARAE